MKSRRYGAAFAILAALLLILLAMNLCIGSVNIPLSEILHILMKNSGSDTYTDIVMNIRFPRALAAAVLGGGLALAGYLLQTFFHNPIAGPFYAGHFFRCKTGGCPCDGGLSRQCPEIEFMGDDCCGFCGGNDLYGICDSDVKCD